MNLDQFWGIVDGVKDSSNPPMGRDLQSRAEFSGSVIRTPDQAGVTDPENRIWDLKSRKI